MELKDFITLGLSSGALCFSIASFALSFRQRAYEDKRSTRKALTDVVAELMQVNLAHNQLDIDHPGSADRRIVNMRRTYNNQRRYLANHGQFLIEQIPELAADIDCVALASAFQDSGDFLRAETFYKRAVEKAPTPALKAWNLRGLARFWFQSGNAALGRKSYQESLEIVLPDTDSMRLATSDTYMLWARVEFDHGYFKEAERAREMAVSAAERIGNQAMRADIMAQIKNSFPDMQRSAEPPVLAGASQK